MPFLRLYGRLDGLVPRKIVPLLDDLWPESESILFDKAAQLPHRGDRRPGGRHDGHPAGAGDD